VRRQHDQGQRNVQQERGPGQRADAQHHPGQLGLLRQQVGDAHPPAARLLLAGVAAATAITTALLAACGAQHQAAKQEGNVFHQPRQVSLTQLTRAIDGLYRSHPTLITFTTQDVQYTDASRKAVLRECTSAEADESTQLTACAPYIFFLYEYGKQAPAAGAVTAAGDLYWYAATHITGSADAKTSLNELLRSWNLPVPAPSKQQARKALTTAIIAEAGDTMLAQKSVHLTITGTSPGTGTGKPAEQIKADVGTAIGSESIDAGTAKAQIRVTKTAAYFAGTPAGLTTLIGLPQAAATKADGRWIAIKKGVREYQDLAAEDTIQALPAAILPTQAEADTAAMTTSTTAGRKVYVLTWTATGDNGTKITAQLTLDATSHALPITETTTANGYRQTVTLTDWNDPITVRPPASSVPYSRILRQ
jgi:hypothetical protein